MHLPPQNRFFKKNVKLGYDWFKQTPLNLVQST